MTSFTVLVHDAEEGGFWAEVPELPGCASQGESLDELERNVIEAINACLEARSAEGVPLPAIRKWELPFPGTATPA
ncbi:MAG: type II toxin-antitoxin system HicB family antitoxin [Dehalococcoidia bacterium]|nr:type II toxin-antitoxin system HicB family antitoxin [Dehalococcoidia bacterium]